uniref:Uncharacterized protein n=1 Tax=Pipistrellus kuhlii TaxID=59472 RepID=A0A7J8B1R3_PIPKU|nr:hypothetical protein mPipKuh1_007674 [Pipistrellus kuhlii]
MKFPKGAQRDSFLRPHAFAYRQETHPPGASGRSLSETAEPVLWGWSCEATWLLLSPAFASPHSFSCFSGYMVRNGVPFLFSKYLQCLLVTLTRTPRYYDLPAYINVKISTKCLHCNIVREK